MGAPTYVCEKCGKIYPTDTLLPCCECGGLFSLRYTLPPFSADCIDSSVWGMFRYRKFMPIGGEGWRSVTLGEGMTPIVPLDENVMLKLEYFAPTLSFKDRGAAVLAWLICELGIERVVQDSSGNAGNAVAAYCGKIKVDCEIFVPKGTSQGKINMIAAHGATVNVVDGSRDDTADACRKKVTDSGAYYASHVYNPYFYEGTKTYIYETFEQLGRIPNHLFIPLGNGTLFIGVIKGLRHLLQSGVIESMPNIYAVQSENCAPFKSAVDSRLSSTPTVTVSPTLAEGIAIGVPMRGEEILRYIKEYNVRVITATEEDILPARETLAKSGIYCEHTAAATYAAYTRYVKEVEALTDVLIPMCGAGLKSDK